MLTSEANQILAVLTIVAQIIFGLGLIYFLNNYKKEDNRVIKFLAEQGIALAFTAFALLILILGATRILNRQKS